MQAEIMELQAQLRDVQDKLSAIQLLLLQKAQTENMMGDWISEQDAIALTGLGRTRLYQLRREASILSSSLGGKPVFYSLKSLRDLLNKNKKKK
jgi:hypothetical protein